MFPARFPRLIVASLALVFPVATALEARPRAAEAAEPPPLPPVSLAAEMSEADLAATGVARLSPEERAALEAWINGRTTRAQAQVLDQYTARGVEGFGLEQVATRTRVPVATPDEVVARIPGNFRGWSGKGAKFVLDNGQVWQAREGGTFSVNLTDPEVRIERGALGTYFLKVKGYGTRVRVERIQ